MADVLEFRAGARKTSGHGGGPATLTGEQVLREGAAMLAEFFTRRLREIPAADPCRAQIEVHVAVYRALGGE